MAMKPDGKIVQITLLIHYDSSRHPPRVLRHSQATAEYPTSPRLSYHKSRSFRQGATGQDAGEGGGKVPRKASSKPKNKQSESQQQSECVAWFREAYPQYARNLFAIPNGGYRSPKTAAILKREGTLAGVPDTFLAIPRKAHHGLFIELKTAKGKPTEKQVEMMAILTSHGYRCEVAYSTGEFKNIIQDYLNAE